MAFTTYLISGASRGLGLETARQLLASSPSVRIIAGARNPKDAPLLDALIKANPDRVETVKLDVSSAAGVEAVVKELKASAFAKEGIDVLWNNAGVAAHGGPLDNDIDVFERMIATNLYGPVRLSQALVPLLKEGKGKQIITTSSILGSIGVEAMGPTATAYSVSKAAVNMYSVKLARELKNDGFTVIVFHPGYVKTDMNGGESGPADITVQDSVQQTLAWSLKLTTKDNGKFYSYTGDVLPW